MLRPPSAPCPCPWMCRRGSTRCSGTWRARTATCRRLNCCTPVSAHMGIDLVLVHCTAPADAPLGAGPGGDGRAVVRHMILCAQLMGTLVGRRWRRSGCGGRGAGQSHARLSRESNCSRSSNLESSKISCLYYTYDYRRYCGRCPAGPRSWSGWAPD